MKHIDAQKLTPPPQSCMFRVSLLSVIIVLLLSGTLLFGNTQDNGTFFKDNNQPKSYDYILYPNSGLSFYQVLTAIQSRYNNNEKSHFSVGLSSGTYDQAVIWLFLDSSLVFDDIYIEFIGLGTNTVILGDNFLMSDAGSLHFTFNNLQISGGLRGIESVVNPDNGALTFLEVRNCKIYANAGSSYGEGVNMDGTGIYAEGPALISGCEIYNNHGKNHWANYATGENFSSGGGIALVNNSIYEAIIEDCLIHDNSAIAGGGVYATGTGQIIIRNNTIYNNTRSIYVTTIYGTTWQLQGGAGEGIWAFECDKLSLTGNIIRNQIAGTVGDRDDMPLSSAVVVEYCGYNPSLTTVLIENNSFMDNGSCHGIWLRYPSGNTRIRNNLACGNKFGIYCSNYTNGITSLTYNDAYGNGTLNGEVQNYYLTHPNYIVQSNNGEYDPLVGTGYAPLWNASVMSPLIDSGYPRTYDPDGTISDIGAIRTGDHQREEYAIPGPSRIKWMSFPVLNEITNDYCMNGNFFEPILNEDWLHEIWYKPYNDGENVIHWVFDNWTSLSDEVSSIQGYKIQMTSTAPADLEIVTSGYLQAPHTVIPLHQGENWLGYFQETSSNPLDALAPILNSIDRIQTQNWTMHKVSGIGWIHSINWVLNYGDMVIVNAVQPCSFSWNNTQPVDPKSVPKATAFDYTEKMNYTPFYITIPEAKSGEMPAEIGLYVNGICKGAAVVEEELTHICAYLEAGEEITPENSNLVFFYPSKSATQSKSIYKFNAGQLTHARDGSIYYSMEIRDLGHVTPAPQDAALAQNYPNPFNPSTTISYDLPEDGLVELNIYNVKGQLVQTLLNKHQGLGTHSVIWDGKDNHANPCSTGMYFYKLTFNGNSITKKMLMMK
jgi:hypothetical protein